ncbi:hypothetical protein EBESD8_51580 [Rhodococcus aetherivorans]|nr:hypothetical protein EBESD8_51580 [Rhodococcus aetherivorans]
MPTAVLVDDGVGGFAGPASLYRIDPPIKGTDHVLVYYRPPMMGQEGQLTVVLATPGGAVFGQDVRPQQGTHVTREPNHHLALQLAGGYQIVDAEPVPAEGAAVESSQLYDPANYTVDDVNAYLAEASPQEQDRVLAVEREGKARKGILGKETP